MKKVIISKEELFLCGACRETSPWNKIYYQDTTPGSPFSTSIHYSHPRVFCPKCGHLVAERTSIEVEIDWVENAKPMLPGKMPMTGGGMPLISEYCVPYEKKSFNLQGYLGKIEKERQISESTKVQTLERLLESMKNSDPEVRLRAAGELVKFKEEKVAKAIVDAFKYKDRRSQDWLERALEEIGEFSIIPLTEGLNNDDSFIRWRAAFTLSEIVRKIPDQRAGEPLLKALISDDNINVKRIAAQALGTLKYRPAIDTLISVINMGDEIGLSAGYALLNIVGPEDKNLVPFFIDALNSENRRLKLVASEVLIKIGEKKITIPTLTKLIPENSDAISVLGELGPLAGPAVPAIINSIVKNRKYHETYAIKALGNIGYNAKRAVPMLEDLLNDENKNVRDTARESLSKIKMNVNPNKVAEKKIKGNTPVPAAKRPNVITIICVLGFISAFLTFLLVFKKPFIQVATWYSPYLALSSILVLICMIGLWYMKKWAIYLYTGYIILNQLVLASLGIWNLFSIFIPAIVAIIAFTNIKKMK